MNLSPGFFSDAAYKETPSPYLSGALQPFFPPGFKYFTDYVSLKSPLTFPLHLHLCLQLFVSRITFF